MTCDCESRPMRMATLLKRWKMRMLGKYKHLSGIASDSESRHSESSLRSASTSCSSPAADSRAAQQCQGGRGSCASFPRTARRRRPAVIRTSETEQPGQPAAKNEFSFTLYDLDGQGRVTQDDIAGLVKTIYDLVGSSMDVPNGGGKTINVRLTVTPEPPPPPRAPLALPSPRDPVTSHESEVTSHCRRHLLLEPPAKRHLTELLRDSMEKNNVTYNNVVSYSNLKRSHTCRDHVRRVPCRPVDSENHYCTVGELFCPNATAETAAAGVSGRPRRRASLRRAAPAPAPARSTRQQQRDDYELLTRCAEFALRAEQAAKKSRRGRTPGGHGNPQPGGQGNPQPGGGQGNPQTSRAVHHHHRHEHVHQHYHHYPGNVLIL